MRFEVLAYGEARQLDGPFYGVKVLLAEPASGASLRVDDLSWPLSVLLPSYRGPVGRVRAVGPLVLLLADEESDDLGAMQVAEQPRVRASVWDSGSVAAGAAIQSPALDASAFRSLTVYADNALGDAARDFNATLYADDGTDLYASAPVAVALGARGVFVFGPEVSASGVAVAASFLSRLAAFRLETGGTKAARLVVFGER